MKAILLLPWLSITFSHLALKPNKYPKQKRLLFSCTLSKRYAPNGGTLYNFKLGSYLEHVSLGAVFRGAFIFSVSWAPDDNRELQWVQSVREPRDKYATLLNTRQSSHGPRRKVTLTTSRNVHSGGCRQQSFKATDRQSRTKITVWVTFATKKLIFVLAVDVLDKYWIAYCKC